MKKFFVAFLCMGLLSLSFVACAKKAEAVATPEATVEAVEATPAADAAVEATPEAAQ
jgi:hypothetical protein